MLGKLIKYEFKATYKLMSLIFVLMIVVSALLAVAQLPWKIDKYAINLFFGSVEIIMGILFVAMNVVILSAMFFYSISRFRKNVLGDAGYLTHTLPVSKSAVIMSKAIVSTVWSILSLLVVVASYILIVLVFDVGALADTVHTLVNTLFDDFYLFIFLIPIEYIIGLFVSYLTIYASMAIGYSFNSNRAVISVAAYIVIGMIKSMMNSMATFAMMMFMLDSILGFYNINIAFSLAFDVVIGVVLFFVTKYFLENKLNLQ